MTTPSDPSNAPVDVRAFIFGGEPCIPAADLVGVLRADAAKLNALSEEDGRAPNSRFAAAAVSAHLSAFADTLDFMAIQVATREAEKNVQEQTG